MTSPRAVLLPTETRTSTGPVLVLENLTAPAFRGFFENLGVGGVQISTDGRFLQVNQRFIELTGYPREELLEMRVGDLDHPDDREPDRERWAAFLNDRRRVRRREALHPP